MSKRFVGKSGKGSSSSQKIRAGRTNEVPSWIRENGQLQQLIRECLPTTYNFELQKTIHQVIQNEVSILGLQIPEGLLQFSLILSDIIRQFCPNCHQIIVLGDVTYGACCVDDFTAKALGCQMLIHYVPVDQTSIKTLYVFVEIGIDRTHLADTIRANFPECMQELEAGPREQARGIKHLLIEHEQGDDRSESEIHLAVVGTVQFVSAVQALKDELEEHPSAPPPSSPIDPLKRITLPTPDPIEPSAIQPHLPPPKCRFKVTVPQVKPLSPGEILGCTAPKLSPDIDAILYLGDGRFHLESIMIANPTIAAFRYDPYEKKITHEGYDHEKMRAVRASAIRIAQESLLSGAGRPAAEEEAVDGDDEEGSGRAWAVVLGTLGRQGSLSVLKSITRGLSTKAPDTTAVPILISELSAAKLGLVSEWIDVCVQTSCPRLSIDWGHDFLLARANSDAAPPRVVPLLNPYEAKVALGQAAPFQLLLNPPSDTQSTALDTYPMDFYADQSLGDWTPRHGRNVRPVRQPAASAA
ncbi:hypothetical protein PCANC_13302 [Puccinia coronata f. sp. avenae]|uniref:2-(3-amino-3-carboxypropyl)histidine synthase subunit 1 n=1 Tax=Puccinia coronata f. sp. avenae TaxID=200324 RepID=A0A2N5SZI9_9BASI|nr:hypothetical protein PCANC_13302 [Puccinia coronata f. sp. avenae]